jgi:hypothetical protein
MKIILFSIAILLFFLSCKKEQSPIKSNSYTIKGIVLDADTYNPISNAKIYCSFLPFISAVRYDSAFSDLQGNVSFTYNDANMPNGLTGNKNGYLPAIVNGYTIKFDAGYDRLDTVFMVKNSDVNLRIHMANTYIQGDVLVVKAKGNIYGTGSGNLSFTDCYTGDAKQLSDKNLTLNAQYFPANPKIYLQWNVSRGGVQLTSGSDSVNLLQYGVINYNLNY